MSDDRRCPRCGRPLPPAARAGACPACLLRAGLEPGSAAPPLDASDAREVTLGFESTNPGSVLESLARSIGSIPRVLLPDTQDDDRWLAVIRPSSPEMPPPSERGGRYVLLGEIARGGMGAVLKGRDPDLGRDLAVKVLLEGHRNKPDLLRRFVEEAQIAGQLQHPGIVPVYEMGAFADSRPYFTMKLVKGRTLAQLHQERPTPAGDLPRFLGIFEQVCQTVAYAHARGVIHRDLKPSNVMVGGFGEVQVMDWGLAKVLQQGGVADELPAAENPPPEVSVIRTVRSGSDADASQAGTALGTPAYMSPEQAGGDIERVDRRADVFGLGSILCEILTGQPAYTGRNQNEVMRKAMRGDTADALSRLEGCGADGELIALARDCLAVEAEDRPRDAGVVADRLGGYLAGVQQRLRAAEVARAQADARAEEERKRRKLALALAAAVVALMALGGTGAAVYLQQRRDAAARLEAALREVSVLHLQARADAGGDPTKWQAVMAAASRARDLLGPWTDPGRRAEVLSMVEEIGAESRAVLEDTAFLRSLPRLLWSVADERDGAPGDARYQAAFRGAGLDVDALGPQEAASKIRSRLARGTRELVEVLDDWAMRRRRARPEDEEAWGRLVATARAADPDPGRDRARAIWSERGTPARVGHLLDLVSQPDGGWSSGIVVLLAEALAEAGRSEPAITLLRRAHERKPRDSRVNYSLARLLESAEPPRMEEAIRCYTAAWAAQPESGHALAHALEGQGRGDEARAVFEELSRVTLGEIRAAICAAVYYPRQQAPGVHPDAKAAPEKNQGISAAVLPPLELSEMGLSPAELHLRISYLATGLEEKIAEAREAERLSYEATGPEEKVAEAREAERLLYGGKDADTRYGAHVQLANLYYAKGDLRLAITELRSALRMQPRQMNLRNNMAFVLLESGDSAAALRSIRESLRIDAGHILSLTTLGDILLVRGRFAEAVPILEQTAVRLSAAGWVKESAKYRDLGAAARRLLGQIAPLRELAATDLKGREQPEALELAACAAAHGRPALASGLYEVVFAVSRARADDLKAGARYRAARAAALAGCGQGEDDPRPDDAARAVLRKQALDRLRSDLTLWEKRLGSGTEAARAECRETLARWKLERDLAGLRDPEALAKLPAEEQEACRKRWADVDALLAKARTDPRGSGRNERR